MTITKSMWEASLEQDLDKKQRQDTEQYKHTQIVGQAMSEIKSDPRWKVYADHIQALKDEADTRADRAGKASLETTVDADAASLKKEYWTFTIKSQAYDHTLKLLETLIDRGDAAGKLLGGIEYGST